MSELLMAKLSRSSKSNIMKPNCVLTSFQGSKRAGPNISSQSPSRENSFIFKKQMLMKPRVLVIVLLLFTFQLHAADYYWVGGGGSWSQLSHWRLGSPTGSIPSIVPSASDNVFFGSYSSFGTTAATKTVTLDANGFCNNMTWESGVANNPVFVTANAAFTVEVWGSMVLSPGTTYTCIFKFKGATPATITSRGNVSGHLGIEIDKPGSSLTVTDSLVQSTLTDFTTNLTNLVAGTFNIAGKRVVGLKFFSVNDNVRALDMTNANVTYTYHYRVTGLNKTVNAAGSVLNATGYLFADNTIYNIVTNGSQDVENYSIYNCTFTKLTFTNPGLSSQARIHDGNTADTIRFMGSGSIGNGNNVNVILGAGTVTTGSNNMIGTLSSAGSVAVTHNNTVNKVVSGGTAGGMGNGNTIGSWQHAGNFSVAAGGINTVDSLLLTPGKVITFRGTFNVNEYLELNGVDCNAYSEVNGDSTTGSLNFTSGAVAVMNNVVLTGVKAFGPITPLTVNGIDNGGNAGFTINEPSGTGTTLYWVGGAGDWNDKTHWSFASGGTGGACVPFKNDNVVFDANSGLASGTVTTSGSSFCNNMTWNGVGTVTFNEAATSLFRIYGSLVMDNTVTMNAFLEFHGSNPATITTNGSTAGTLQFIIDKTDAAVVTLSDNWNNPTGGSIVQRKGGLNLSGRTVSFAVYSSAINATRSLDLTNATLNLTDYDYRGTGKTIASTGSHITTTRGVAVDGLTYPWVDANYAGNGSYFDINNTTFGQLTFNATGTTVNADIEQGNTIRRLEYKGKGFITGGGNTIDTLILAGSRNYFFGGTNTITKYFKAQSSPCAGLSEIRNYSPAGPTATLNFTAGAVVDMANVYMQNITATGPITPIAFNGADAGGNMGWTINVPAGGARYWVNGAGDWNDGSHWSTTSGGTGGTACVPTVYDDVYFDANSGFGTTAATRTVTVNNGNAYAHNINWTGATNNPVWSKPDTWNMEIWGDSLITTSPATFNLSLTLKGSNAAFMKGSSPAGTLDIYIDKPGGGLTLLNNYSNTQSRFFLTNGAFNASGRTLTFHTFSNESLANTSSVDISNSTITLNGAWGYAGPTANHALNAANSTITSQFFNATGFTYNKVNVNGSLSNSATFNSTTVDSLVFTQPSTSSQAGINGTGNLFNYVEYKGAGGIYGTNNTIDTLVFFPGNRYTLTSGTNTRITGEWYGSGTPCRLTEIVSSSTTNATITKTSGDVSFDYVRLQRITGTGGATYNTQPHSINLGGNTGWSMAPYDGAAPIEGLGPDTLISPSDWPYVLHTNGFFGAPSSQYTWGNGSVADTLEVTGPGTYNVSVTFPDGCNIKDTIVLTEGVPLPVTLQRFTASLQENCSSIKLSWSTSSEQNSKDFTVQRSLDGSSWSNTGTVAAAGNSNEQRNYSFTDATVGGSNLYIYRLQMNDIDGQYKNSSLVSVRLNCGTNRYFIYPNPVKDHITIQTSSMGTQKVLAVYNGTGQRLLQRSLQAGTVETISAAGWKPGVYIAVITENGKQVHTEKLMKQ